MANIRISVVTIVYNDAAHIERTLKSVIGQSAKDRIDYIVVDGMSTDGTSEIIQRYEQSLSKYIREADQGIYDAMNKGLRAATGDYVIFMNSGDCFSETDVVERIIGCAEKTGADIVYGHYRELDDSGCESKDIPCRDSKWIWYGMVASHQSIFYGRNLLVANNIVFDQTYKIAADYKLTAEAIRYARKVCRVPFCISDFDVSGLSSNNQNAGLKEANRVRREVLGWGNCRIGVLTCALLGARYFKLYAGPIYRYMRKFI